MTQGGLGRKCKRPGKLLVFTREHRGPHATLSVPHLWLGSVRERTDILQDGCQQPVSPFSQRAEKWSRGLCEDCTSAVVTMTTRHASLDARHPSGCFLKVTARSNS